MNSSFQPNWEIFTILILLCVFVPVFPFLLKPLIFAAALILLVIVLGKIRHGQTQSARVLPDGTEQERLSDAELLLRSHREKVKTDSALSEEYIKKHKK